MQKRTHSQPQPQPQLPPEPEPEPRTSPFVAALRHALAILTPAAAGIGGSGAAGAAPPGEAIVAGRVVRDLEQTLARLEGRDANEGDLISIVCHDLKDPLASIVMGAGFLRKTVPESDGPGRRVVEAIVRSTDRMGQVVGDFHDLAKIQGGRVVLDLRPWDVVAILHAAVKALQPKAEERNLRLELDVPASPLLGVCDRLRLTQVVSKLVANAIKFTTGDGGSKGRGGGRVVVSAKAEGGRITVAVTDTGRGIPADRLTSIFDHAANAKRTPRDGPGLGLPIAQGLALLHGERIEVKSQVDQGSTFSFSLLEAAPAAPAAPPSR